MSSSSCQGLQSCLEPRIVEPRILIQNLAPPKSNFSQCIPWSQMPNLSQPQEQNGMVIENESNNNITINKKYYNFVDAEHENNKDGDLVWSSIQTFTRTSQNRKQVIEAEQVYVHPLDKRSSSMLSTKSLEMCTESLGSETGSSTDESIDDFPFLSLGRRDFEGIQRSRSRQFTKKTNQVVSFPPPLTSISGSDGVKVRPHREGGRLVLKAVTISSCSSYFRAERANGRLRLSLLTDNYTDSNNIHDFDDEYEENVCNMQHLKGNEQENKNAEEEKEEIEMENIVDADDVELEVNCESVEYEIGGVGEFPRPSRCKEGEESTRNKGMPSWGPFCVAIS